MEKTSFSIQNQQANYQFQNIWYGIINCRILAPKEIQPETRHFAHEMGWKWEFRVVGGRWFWGKGVTWLDKWPRNCNLDHNYRRNNHNTCILLLCVIKEN